MSVFISYNSRDDLTIPRQVKSELEESAGLCTFLDSESIRAGTSWRTSITKSLESARVLVVMAGPAFFEASQLRRLELPDSVIRFELETARARRECRIMPVYFEAKPPHRSGLIWPRGLEWLSELQWSEIQRERINGDIESLTREICQVFADDALKLITLKTTSATIVLTVDQSRPEVYNALLRLMTENNFHERQLRDQVRLLGDVKVGRFSHDPGDALRGVAAFSGVRPWVRAVYSLCGISQMGLQAEVKDIDTFDHFIREQANDLSRLRTPAAAFEDAFVLQYLSIAIRRFRERTSTLNLNTPELLERHLQQLSRLPEPQRKRLESVMEVLTKWRICCDSDDAAAFRGRGKLRQNVRFVRGGRRGSRGRNRSRRRGPRKGGR